MNQCPKCHSKMQSRGTTKTGRHKFYCKNCDEYPSYPSEIVDRTARVLVFDIETLPMVYYGWDLYKPVFSHDNIIKDWCVLSWSAKWLFDDKFYGQILTPKEAKTRNDYRIVEGLWKMFDEADIVIGHNAKKFDVRKMNTRFLYHGFVPPSQFQTIDTLLGSRETFSLPSYSQDYITKFLELQEKIETDFQLWIDCDNGDRIALAKMMEYNEQDIRGLEEMYVTLRPWLPKHPNLAVYMTTEEAVCPKCQSKEITLGGTYATPANLYRSFRCNNCGTIGRTNNTALTTQKRKHLVKAP